MEDYTSRYEGYDVYDRRAIAREMLDGDDGLHHIVVGYKDSDYQDVPVFLVFGEDEEEWDKWTDLYQYLGGYVDACHTSNPIYR